MSFSKRDLYAEVTSAIMDALEEGVIPWVRPWKTRGLHRNFTSGREYSGINALLLNVVAARNGFEHPLWGTVKQINDAGGRVKPGSKGALVVFWKVQEYPKRDPRTMREIVGEDGRVEMVKVPILKHFHVFNVPAQTEGLTVVAPAPIAPVEPVAAADATWERYEGRPALAHAGDAAFYLPSIDRIVLPKRERFHSAEGYYHTLFHESVHSTGARTRLNRVTLTQAGRFGDENYSQEELVAEVGAAMLLAHAGMQPEIRNNAAYVQGWLRALHGDKKLIIVASAQAEKAADWILGENRTEPALAADKSKEASTA